ncbi:DUF2490 domain-containing protein [uncultured Maribacter sp.]|uniref:DUF2490 domain-containing protein n=1 Tax=uncultured Maribacter sp. TaxID=431308 RepID=UPI00260C08FD|nr:DUF2490 domain-containing protein [uncultured Maribacter sp.]
MCFTRITSVLLLLSLLQSIAQEKKEDYLGSWSIVSGSHRIADKWSIPTEAYYGTYKLYNCYHDFYFRTGITYQPSSKLKTTIGFAFVDMEPFTFVGSNYNSEQNVIYEELNVNHNFRKLKIGNRFRLENRWTKAGGDKKYDNRFRYRLRFTHPIIKALYASFHDEFLMNLKGNVFNQNRIQCSLGYKITPNFKIECGYLFQSFPKISYHRLRLVLLFNIDWRKKSSI